ncbi:threonine-phosphate decarboxylase CobD [Thiorhodovibrio winogradskyi]|uniref:threonine-phosphate decarboxylase CobD n=1 Tax=Thiorhodovibrio winogradskyi TaxID=77007 RepID=UPI002E2C44A1|nr:threonine-phosphate decarboxylase CobD [Thiorhodovibrio winogradskyi]
MLAAAARFGIPASDWLDLSTGVNPNGWPVPAVPASCWQRLPEDDDGLETAARAYYGGAALLPVAGSQAAIQVLPRLRQQLQGRSRVAVLTPGYAEHAAAWRGAGHLVSVIDALGPADAIAARIDAALADSEVLVLIHPNNPSGLRLPADQLLDWHRRLAARGGWLLVDEAFMDATPGQSLAAHGPRPGLIVLRSLGKFFGLAGARVGFVLGEPALLASLRALLGPWSVSGPARWVATRALEDRAWQAHTRAELTRSGQRLCDLLDQHGLTPTASCALFAWVCTDRAETRWRQLAAQGILTRLFDAPASLRFGLPGGEDAWQRLAHALQA